MNGKLMATSGLALCTLLAAGATEAQSINLNGQNLMGGLFQSHGFAPQAFGNPPNCITQQGTQPLPAQVDPQAAAQQMNIPASVAPQTLVKLAESCARMRRMGEAAAAAWKAASLRDPGGEKLLGYFYVQGMGVPRDP